MQEHSRLSLNSVLTLATNTRWKMERETLAIHKIVEALKTQSKWYARHSKTSLYKTQMCNNIQTLGFCKFGSDCLFAHSTNELRSVPPNLPNTPHFTTSSNGPVFEFTSELFQQQQRGNFVSLAENAAFESAPRLMSESHIEEAFYSVPNSIINPHF